MPGYLLDANAFVFCEHGGRAQPIVPSPRVRLSGRALVTQPGGHLISNCTLPPLPILPGQCQNANWVSGAARVKSGGQPVLLQDSRAVCVPAGTGILVLSCQTRVKGC